MDIKLSVRLVRCVHSGSLLSHWHPRRLLSGTDISFSLGKQVLYSGDNSVMGADRVAAFTVHSPKMRDALRIVMRTPLVFLSAGSSSKEDEREKDSTLSPRNFSAMTNPPLCGIHLFRNAFLIYETVCIYIFVYDFFQRELYYVKR